jgi:hypothetical protein
VSAIGDAYELERSLARLFELEKHLVDDIDRTFPIRLFRQGRRMGAEPVLESVYRGVRKALKDHPDLSVMMSRFDVAYEQALVRGADRTVVLNKLAKERRAWEDAKKLLAKKDPRETEDLIAWIDRDIEERMAIARKLSGRDSGLAAKPGKKAGTAKKLGGAKKPLKQAEVDAAKQAEAAREAYEGFVEAMSRSDPDTFVSFEKLASYFKHDDPIWGRIAEKVAAHRSGKKAIDAIQGVLGEALAMRHAWVVDSVVRATERAERIAAKLGREWEVVYTQLPVVGSTKTGGMGELYDASVWVVKKSKGVEGEVLEAAPVFVLQVKSGNVKTAVEQTGRDFTRELKGKVRLPVAAQKGPREFNIRNLKDLLKKNQVKPTRGKLGDMTTQRILVAPRPPSERSIRANLPPGTAIEYVEALMAKNAMNKCSERIAKAIGKKY